MAVSHDRAEDSAAPSQTPGAEEVPTRLEVPPEVAQAWSGIRLGWKDKTNGKEGNLDVPLGEAAPLPDPSLVVRADVFLPAFAMGGGALAWLRTRTGRVGVVVAADGTAEVFGAA